MSTIRSSKMVAGIPHLSASHRAVHWIPSQTFERGHQAVQIGIILLVYGLIHLWLKANAAALSNMDQSNSMEQSS